MPRVKRGKTHVKKRKKLLKQAKGFKWGRKKLIKQAKEAVIKSGADAYKGRKTKKRDARQSWNVNINSALKKHNLSYSKFINKLKTNNVELDRKVLADLAANNPKIFDQIVKKVK